jgi:hypothetical protein
MIMPVPLRRSCFTRRSVTEAEGMASSRVQKAMLAPAGRIGRTAPALASSSAAPRVLYPRRALCRIRPFWPNQSAATVYSDCGEHDKRYSVYSRPTRSPL